MSDEEKKAIKSLEGFAYTIHGILSVGEAKILLNLIQKQQEKIEYYKSQKTSDDQFKSELLETIRCKSLEIDSLNKILDDRLICIQGGRGLYAKLKGLDREYLIREYLSMYKMCKQELEKKDKIIDLMSETLRYYNGVRQEQTFCWDICGEKKCNIKNCKECIKQYFERKVSDEDIKN